MRLTIFPSILFLSLAAAAGTPTVPEHAPYHADMNYDAAKTYCDSAPLRGPEGIYSWPDAGALVLVRDASAPADASPHYEIVALQASDILMEPGQTVGYLYPTASEADYHLYLYEVGDEGASSPRHLAARYDAGRHSFEFKDSKTRVRFNPFFFIPRVRSAVRVQRENPAADLPDGLRLVYPVAEAKAALPRYF